MFWTLLQFILAFGVILFLHELGHFISAKAFGVEVEEFGFGLPPRIVKLFTWKGTDFTLNCLPFGAFVKPKGEFDGDDSLEGGFKSAKPWQQLIIYFAGPLMNLVTLIVILMVIAQVVGIPDSSMVLIDRVLPDSPALDAGLKAGDVIYRIDDRKIDSIDAAVTAIYRKAGGKIEIEVSRDGEILTLDAKTLAVVPADRGPLGVELTNPMMKVSFVQGVQIGIQDSFSMITSYLRGLGMLFTGQINLGEGLVGPVGIYSMFADVAEIDAEAAKREADRQERIEAGEEIAENSSAAERLPWYNRLMFLAMISMAVGISNLLPIPALDGGRILLLIPELIFKKSVPAKVEVWLNTVGMILVLGLSVFLIFKDVLKLVVG